MAKSKLAIEGIYKSGVGSTAPGASHASELPAAGRGKLEQIVAAAIRVFLENGYSGTSMNRVAEEAGVIKQTIYSHFTDKESLFVAIIEELTIKRFKADFEAGLCHTTPEELFEYMIKYFGEQRKNQQYLSLVRLVVGESERFPDLARLYFKTVVGPCQTMLATYFDAHPELDKVDDSLAAAAIAAGAFVSSMMCQEILLGKEFIPIDIDRVGKQLTKLFIG